jgi:hypothetical protein
MSIYDTVSFKAEPILLGFLFKVVKSQLCTNGYIDYTRTSTVSYHLSMKAALVSLKNYKEGLNG